MWLGEIKIEFTDISEYLRIKLHRTRSFNKFCMNPKIESCQE